MSARLFPSWSCGELVDAREPIDEPRGVGLFETLLHESGRRPLEARHLARFERGARAFGLPWPPPWDPERALAELGAALGDARCALRMTLARGVDGASIALSIRARDVEPLPEPGVELVVERDARLAGPELSGFKTTSRASYERARAAARARGAWDALLLARTGEVVETSIANLFVVLRGRVVTPRLTEGGLPGIARGLLLEALARAGEPAEVRAVELDELARAEELFLTNAVRGIVPVVAVHDLARGLPARAGATTRAARRLLARELGR